MRIARRKTNQPTNKEKLREKINREEKNIESNLEIQSKNKLWNSIRYIQMRRKQRQIIIKNKSSI